MYTGFKNTFDKVLHRRLLSKLKADEIHSNMLYGIHKLKLIEPILLYRIRALRTVMLQYWSSFKSLHRFRNRRNLIIESK